MSNVEFNRSKVWGLRRIVFLLEELNASETIAFPGELLANTSVKKMQIRGPDALPHHLRTTYQHGTLTINIINLYEIYITV